MQFFQTNINQLKIKNPHLATRLEAIKEVKDFEIFMDDGDIATLNFVHKEHFTPLYEGSPLQTVQSQAQEYQEFAKHPYLYIYGIANGVLLKHLLDNEIHNRIMVIEPELEMLYIVLHMIDFSADIESGRLVLFGYEDIDFPTITVHISTYQEQKYAKTYSLHINTTYYDKQFFDHMQHTNRILIESLYHSVNLAGNDTTDALIGLKQHIGNLSRVLETPPLFEFMQKLHTCDTAVLVSTGPSLSKQLPLLKEIAPYVRIIAVDASFPVLHNAGIKPDVVVSIERVKASARFFTDTPKEAFKDVVFALSSLQHTDVVNSIKGGTMQMSLRPLGIMKCTGPAEWGFLGLGQSAANMAYEIIYHAKFKNCILIGQDLAFGADGTSHASGHVFTQENVKTKESDVWVKGWQGKDKVRTNHIWDIFRRSFEKDIAETKATMLTINATEGGVSIYGTQEIPFADAVKKHVKLKRPKKTIKLQTVIETEKKRITKEVWKKVDTIRDYVATLLEESKTLFLEVAAACEQNSTEDAKALIERIEIIKARYDEEIYEDIVWHIAQTTMLSREIELAPLEVFISQDIAQEQERLQLLIEKYKPWLFIFAGILDAIVKTIDYAKARTLIDEVKTIDVYIEDTKIDTMTCHDLKAEHGRVFDVDMRGILYDASDKYQEKLEQIIFKDAKSGKELPRVFADVITKDDVQYDELNFMRSIQELEYTATFEFKYLKNVVSFIAIHENTQDKYFVSYVCNLAEQYP
ncbi:MAG: DUF115 domain-containing protein, partial [Sulfurimonadaceae bacterium]|nr:DUF115 domain-containing protein [Sulfurimonadaceae bacterium]